MSTAPPAPARVREVEAARKQFGTTAVDRYLHALMKGDELADAFADDCRQMGKGRGMAMLHRWLNGESIDQIDDAPESLVNLVQQLRSVPDYVDFAQVDRGAAAFSRHAREAGIALSTTSLVSGYNNPAASKPLIVTGRFADMAPVRAIETSMWVFTVARPGGLYRMSEGFKRTVRVRMIHAFVRQHILNSGDWDTANDGIPINQADLAYTVVEFMWLPIRSITQLGAYYTEDDLAAIYAMWRYMGYLMGVDEDVLVRNGAEAQAFEDLHLALSLPPNDDCRRLTHALLTEVLAIDLQQASGIIGIIGRRYGRQFVHGLSRAFVGPQIADALEIDDNRWQFVPKLTYPAVNIAGRIRYRIPGAHRRQMRRNLAEIDSLLATNAQLRGMTHDLVDSA